MQNIKKEVIFHTHLSIEKFIAFKRTMQFDILKCDLDTQKLPLKTEHIITLWFWDYPLRKICQQQDTWQTWIWTWSLKLRGNTDNPGMSVFLKKRGNIFKEPMVINKQLVIRGKNINMYSLCNIYIYQIIVYLK